MWDKALKKLVGKVPQDVVSWLLPGAIFEQEVSPHLQNRQFNADMLYQVRLDDVSCLFHVEFQSKSDPDMAQRILEYNVQAKQKYDLPVHSFVMYLKKGKDSEQAFGSSPYVIQSSPGRVILRFYYTVIKMWEIPTEALLTVGPKGLLPLVPLTADGWRREAMEEAIALLMPEGEKPDVELLSILKTIGGLIYMRESDHEWLKWRCRMIDDLLTESWVCQEWIQQGLEKGRQEGVAEGIAKGRQEGVAEGRRQDIVTFVQKRFPALSTLAERQVALLQTPEQLQQLLLQVVMAQDEQEARRSLLDATEETR